MVTGKDLKDLATDKPEDIAKELEARAKAREPVPVEDPEPGAETEKVDEPENTEEAPAEGDAAKEPAPSEKQEPEEAPLLKRLRSEPGMEKHSYKDEEAFVKSHASLRKKLSARDEDAALGRALREAGVSPEDIAEVFKTRSEPAKGKDKAPIEWDPAWDREIERVENENGKTELRGPPEMIRQYREYEAQFDSFKRAPKRTILDNWGLKQDIEGIVNSALNRQRGQETFEAFMKENGDFIEENRDEIGALARERNWPVTAAIDYLKLKRDTEGLKAGKTAEDAKKADIDRLKGKATRRNGAAVTPVRSARDLAKLPLKDAVEAKLADAGESIPESW